MLGLDKVDVVGKDTLQRLGPSSLTRVAAKTSGMKFETSPSWSVVGRNVTISTSCRSDILIG